MWFWLPLLYKRHPSQLKFVLVDPKVEMSLFSKIERHYWLTSQQWKAIITDTRKWCTHSTSLRMEMENRYENPEDAGAKTWKNTTQFVARKLNPKDGHRFCPTSCWWLMSWPTWWWRPVAPETPIARLCAVGTRYRYSLGGGYAASIGECYHGRYQANFPRLSFRVTSKVDSRTILDTGGADQLIGQGDMLLSGGSDIIRLQCPFVDTPEVERLRVYWLAAWLWIGIWIWRRRWSWYRWLIGTRCIVWRCHQTCATSTRQHHQRKMKPATTVPVDSWPTWSGRHRGTDLRGSKREVHQNPWVWNN